MCTLHKLDLICTATFASFVFKLPAKVLLCRIGFITQIVFTVKYICAIRWLPMLRVKLARIIPDNNLVLSSVYTHEGNHTGTTETSSDGVGGAWDELGEVRKR